MAWLMVPALALGAAAFIFAAIFHDGDRTDVLRAFAMLGFAVALIAGASVLSRLRLRANRGGLPESILQRVAIIAAMIAVASWVLVLVALDHGFRRQHSLFLREFEAFGPAFEADRERLRTSPLFLGIGQERDAGEFLNSLVGWLGERATAPAPILALPEQFPAPLEGLDFPAIEPETIAGFNTAWMAELRPFDHWKIDLAAPRSRPFDMIFSPQPDYVNLMRWAKVRAAQGYISGDVREASADLHQLARLAASTDSLIGTMVGVTILKTDRLMVEAQHAHLPAGDVSWWLPFSQEDDAAVRRAGWASLQYLNPYAPPREWGLLDASTPFDCVGLQEGLFALRQLRGDLEDSLPSRYSDADSRIQQVAVRCRFTGVIATWSQPANSFDIYCEGEWNSFTFGICTRREIAKWVPFSSKLVARLEAVTCDTPNCGFALYRRMSSQ